jgi:hypothetical protein
MKKQLTFCLALLILLCTSAHAQLPSYLPSDGLVAWYPFNGNANDESGNGNDGVVNGALMASDRFGNQMKAYSFDGLDDYIDCGSMEGIAGIAQMTISCWINYESIINSSRVFGREETNNSSYGLALALDNFNGNNNGIKAVMRNGSNTLGNANSVLQPLQYFHVVLVYNGQSNGNSEMIKMYINGMITSLIYTGNIPSLTHNNEFNAWIGGSYPSSVDAPFHGILDDIAIYNRALTEQEIQNLYNAPSETLDTGDGAAPLPQGIPYQAAARDALGQVIADAPVNVRFSLHEGAVDGAVSYSETHALTTNGIGLFNTVFGNGTPEQSAFDSINWAATTKFLQVEIDLGDGYVDMGTTQLLSVPYAFRSDEAARIKNAGLPIFADNAAALAGGLVAGEMYRTASGDLKVAY